MSQTSLEAEVAAVIDALGQAHERLTSGGMADIEPLAARIDQVCGQIRQLPPEQARQFRGRLESAVSGLDSLEQEVRARFEQLTEALERGRPEAGEPE